MFYSTNTIKSNSAIDINRVYGHVAMPNNASDKGKGNSNLMKNLKIKISYSKTGAQRQEDNFGSKVIERWD